MTTSLTEEDRAWLRLARTDGIGTVTFRDLYAHFGSALEIVANMPLINKGKGKSFQLASLQDIDQEIKEHDRRGVGFLFPRDYPFLLKQVIGAPLVMSYRGRRELLDTPCVAVVGARHASLSGQRLSAHLAKGVGERGYTIVSGMARGIDAAAHKNTLDTGTIGVLGGGIDTIYPAENRALFEEMYEKGLLLSEVPIGVSPQARFFPSRNRIISGLSYGVVVVEAAIQSGTFITAQCALEQGRLVFAVPGSPMDPRSLGTNRLLRQGAVFTETADDIVDALAPQQPRAVSSKVSEQIQISSPARNLEDETILQNLSSVPILVDELVRECQLSPGHMHAILTKLELDGIIERHAGNRVSLTKK